MPVTSAHHGSYKQPRQSHHESRIWGLPHSGVSHPTIKYSSVSHLQKYHRKRSTSPSSAQLCLQFPSHSYLVQNEQSGGLWGNNSSLCELHTRGLALSLVSALTGPLDPAARFQTHAACIRAVTALLAFLQELASQSHLPVTPHTKAVTVAPVTQE